MATAKEYSWKDLENKVKCSICLGILQEPVKLHSCRHCFCRECIKKLPVVEKNGHHGIECPKCRRFNKTGDYSNSFVMNKFVELYKQHSINTDIKCSVCHENYAIYMCTDCDLHLCDKCHASQLKTQTSQEHHFQSCDTAKDSDLRCKYHPDKKALFHCQDCHAFVCETCITETHNKHNHETIESSFKNSSSKLEEIVESLEIDLDYCRLQDNYVASQKQDVKKDCQALTSRYQSTIERRTEESLEVMETQSQWAMQEIERKKRENFERIQIASQANRTHIQQKQRAIELMQTTLKTMHGIPLLKLAKTGFLQKLRAEEQKPMQYSSVNVTMPVFTPNPRIDETYMAVKPPGIIQEVRPDVTLYERSRIWALPAREILDAFGEEEMKVNVQGEPSRIALVNGNVWIASNISNNEYQIFNTSNNQVITTSHSTLQCVNAFWQTDSDEVMVACNNGLFSFTPSGQIKYRIADGWFTDICGDSERLVAIETKACLVQVFKRSSESHDRKWMEETVFLLKDKDRHLKHVHLCNKTIYISYNWKRKIYKYSLAGDYLGEYGTSNTTGKPGSFAGPCVCASDCEGAIIVCDPNKQCVQVGSLEGDWKEFRFRGDPMVKDVLLVGERLYSLCRTSIDTINLTVYRIYL